MKTGVGRPKIDAVLVVEGRADSSNIKKYFDCECIITHGFVVKSGVLKQIKKALETREVIVLTDPDYAGETIRKKISEVCPNVAHAFIPRESALKDGDIGVENASEEAILSALGKRKKIKNISENAFTILHLENFGLTGSESSSVLRDEIGAILGIGYANSKTFLARLNAFGISKAEFEEAVKVAKGRPHWQGHPINID